MFWCFTHQTILSEPLKVIGRKITVQILGCCVSSGILCNFVLFYRKRELEEDEVLLGLRQRLQPQQHEGSN